MIVATVFGVLIGALAGMSRGWLDTALGADCLTRGCAARRACPRSQAYARVADQSAYHMGQFHR